MRGLTWIFGLALMFGLCLAAVGLDRSIAQECEGTEFSSTFELIQKAIFENKGCTSDICHGAAQSGGLDLRPEVAYENLIDRDAETVLGYKRVLPGQKDASLLFLNLAAKTLPEQYEAPLRAMPLDPLPALSVNEVEAIRQWIEGGAPRDGVVRNTGDLLDACLPPAEPIDITPLPPPEPGEGLQIRMPQWVLNAQSEREVCFASYYDVTDQVPVEFRGPDGTTFRYMRNDVRQDPASHHLIVNLYTGTTPPTHPAWGEWKCRGGELDGQVCDPLNVGFCGPEGECGSTPVTGVACIGFGPPDAGIGLATAGFSGTQETASEFVFAPGVYREVPLKGILLWNSHAFNLTDTPGKLDAWLNFEFAPPDEQIAPSIQIFDTDSIFTMRAPAFGTDEVCAHHVLPPNANLFEISSHMHQRGKRFRVFRGAFRCQGGAASGAACSSFGPDFASRDICQGAPCAAFQRQKVGDCNLNGEVTVDELVTSVNIALGENGMAACPDADISGDAEVSVDELITSVNAALNGVPPPTQLDPEEALFYTSLIYNDPVVLRMNPPLIFPGAGSSRDDRTLTFCAFYDNGFTHPSTVKRRSTSPPPPINAPGIGGPCQVPTGCTEGRVGEACGGGTEEERNVSCDTSPGAGDGFCDACLLRGGVTTEDEMFLLLGQYFIPPSD